MKNLLMSKKKSFVRYIIACFFFIITDLGQAFLVAMIFNAIEVGTMAYLYKTIIVSVVLPSFPLACFWHLEC